MTQIILEIKDNSILPALEKTLRLIKGVHVEKIVDGVPNHETQAAIEEANTGKVIRCKNSKDMFASLRK